MNLHPESKSSETAELPPASQGSLQGRRLYRHPGAGEVGGVCAGIADAFGWQPAAVRVLWAVATLATSGAGLLVYLLLWVLLPVGTQAGGRERGAHLDAGGAGLSGIALVLLGLGGLWLLSNLGVLPAMGRLVGFFLRVLFWPALLMGLGYWLLRRSDPSAATCAGSSLRESGSSLRARGSAWSQARRARRAVAPAGPAPAAPERVAPASTAGAAHDANALHGRPLQRCRDGRIFLGVAAGTARWLNLDPVVARLLWVLLIAASGGAGLLLYFVAAILIPLEPTAAPLAALRPYRGPNSLPEEFQAVPIWLAPAPSAESVDLRAVSLEELDRAELASTPLGEVVYL